MAKSLEQAMSKAASVLVEKRALEDANGRLRQQVADAEEGSTEVEKSVSLLLL